MKHIIYTLILCCLSLPVLSAEKVQIVIETEILAPDPQPGLKSRHVIQVYFDNKKVLDAYETGTTDFFGIDLRSVRDKFRFYNVSFPSEDTAKLDVSGETASGVRTLPNINYSFKIVVKKNGSVNVTGCHDGYPAYRIIVNGTSIYSHKHKAKDLLSLFGDCDTKVKI